MPVARATRPDRHRCREAAPVAGRLAVEALGDAAQGVRHHARPVREHAVDGGRHALRHDPVQQPRRARCRNRQRAMAIRRPCLRAWSAALEQRMEAAGNRHVARRWTAAHLPQQPASARAAGRRDREAGRLVWQQRRDLVDGRAASHRRHHARVTELSAGRLSRPRHRRQPGSRSRAVAGSDGLRAGVQRAHGPARVGVLDDSAVGHRSRRRDVGERVVAPERARQRLGADGARRAARAAVSADLHADRATTTVAIGRAPTCSPNRSCVSMPRPAR